MSERDDLRRRMAKVIEQYLQLDTALRKAESTHFRICIFGSARIQPHDAIYNTVYEVARRLADMGIDIVTGGGPGLMEAANRAAHDAHAKHAWSYGLPLDIPGLGEVANSHLDIKSMHRRFSSRLDEFMRLSDGVIVAPGGIGTLLELFYVWQLLQLAMVEPRPVVLLGTQFWGGLIRWMSDTVLGYALVSAADLDHIRVVDTPDEAVAAIQPVFEAYREARRHARPPRRGVRPAAPAPSTHPDAARAAAPQDAAPAAPSQEAVAAEAPRAAVPAASPLRAGAPSPNGSTPARVEADSVPALNAPAADAPGMARRRRRQRGTFRGPRSGPGIRPE